MRAKQHVRTFHHKTQQMQKIHQDQEGLTAVGLWEFQQRQHALGLGTPKMHVPHLNVSYYIQ